MWSIRRELAEIRPVIVGEWIGEDWIINQGLKAGDRVIVEGFQRLAPGAPVKVVSTGSLPSTPAAPQAGSPAPAAPPGAPSPPARPATR